MEFQGHVGPSRPCDPGRPHRAVDHARPSSELVSEGGAAVGVRTHDEKAASLSARHIPLSTIYFLAVMSCASNTSTRVPPFPLLPPAMTSGTSFMPLAARARATSMVA